MGTPHCTIVSYSSYVCILFYVIFPKVTVSEAFAAVVVFLGLHLWHMEVPRLGVELELQLPPIPQPQQHQIRAESATYTTAHNNAGSLTH